MIKINVNKDIIIYHKGKKIKVFVIYRKRKTITITIKPKEYVTIISPLSVGFEALEKILYDKADWILKKIDEYKDLNDISEDAFLKDGKLLFYLGTEYSLRIIKCNKPDENNVNIDKNEILVYTFSLNQNYIRDILKKWYKKESEKIVIEKLQKLKNKSTIMANLTPTIIKVKEQKKIWGSCNSKGNIYINSKISMARPKSIEYILVHEFSHLVHMNHSKEFYRFVGRIMPSYKDEEFWLKNNSYKLKL